MRLLFVIPYVPDLIRVRSYNFIHFLAERDHEITLATLWSDESDKEALTHLETICERVIAVEQPRWRSLVNCLGALPAGRPMQAVYSWSPALAQQLDELLAESISAPFAAIHVEHLRGVAYALHLQRRLLNLRPEQRPVLVWDSVDSISLLFRLAAVHNPGRISRLINRFELPRTERYEGWLARQLPHILLTSARDRDAFLTLAQERPAAGSMGEFSVVPNGVDLDYFQPGLPAARAHDTLVVTGKMSYHANVAMVLRLFQRIMPHVWARFPETKLQIVGKDPVAAISQLGEHPQVTVTGMVPEIRPFLQQATVAVATIPYGVGIQNKVLEAMACAAPVVTTPEAMASLQAEPGQDLLVGDSDEACAEAIVHLLADEAYRAQIGQAGRDYVTEWHDWYQMTGRLETLYGQPVTQP